MVHWFSADGARDLVARLASVLAPGGVIAIKEPRLEDDRAGTRTALLFNLSLLAYAPGDGIPTVGAVSGWLAESGLHVTVHLTRESPNSIVWCGRRMV